MGWEKAENCSPANDRAAESGESRRTGSPQLLLQGCPNRQGVFSCHELWQFDAWTTEMLHNLINSFGSTKLNHATLTLLAQADEGVVPYFL